MVEILWISRELYIFNFLKSPFKISIWNLRYSTVCRVLVIYVEYLGSIPILHVFLNPLRMITEFRPRSKLQALSGMAPKQKLVKIKFNISQNMHPMHFEYELWLRRV